MTVAMVTRRGEGQGAPVRLPLRMMTMLVCVCVCGRCKVGKMKKRSREIKSFGLSVEEARKRRRGWRDEAESGEEELRLSLSVLICGRETEMISAAQPTRPLFHQPITRKASEHTHTHGRYSNYIFHVCAGKEDCTHCQLSLCLSQSLRLSVSLTLSVSVSLCLSLSVSLLGTECYLC